MNGSPSAFLPFATFRSHVCLPRFSADCSASSPEQSLLREELSSSLQLAEQLSKQYDELLRSYQQKMLNTSALLKQLNEQFNWVSQLANLTQREDPFSLQVTTVRLVLELGPKVQAGDDVTLPGGGMG